ncbi:uncharacterized protein BDZ83DRAFT_643892 [Colletotrichum acutatum]|uniref:Uncharacterized protein n=1 Tax=Glomerella acutata TaxID=27357 RepID=A0AAD8UBJ4_GLOAC|nr:uncharacterized protein BDZ83DRAFT_643892 [Colletotrichum acutatum]KAK1706107.1 hypothetical protein BDZ83DRAFT_643892 [Colletotrichum acutatum]
MALGASIRIPDYKAHVQHLVITKPELTAACHCQDLGLFASTERFWLQTSEVTAPSC